MRAAYVRALADASHAHAICEEYRAGATIDREHDSLDLAGGRRIACPLLVLWSSRGPLAQWYSAQGGPLGIWRTWAHDVEGRALDAGPFFPEEAPTETAAALSRFFAQPRATAAKE